MVIKKAMNEYLNKKCHSSVFIFLNKHTILFTTCLQLNIIHELPIAPHYTQ